MIFVAKQDNGETMEWVDRKRYLWVLSILSPSLPGICALLLINGGGLFWAAFPLIFYFGFVPVIDMIVGEDLTNPPEEIVEKLSQDDYYRYLLFASIPVFYFSFFAVAYAIATTGMPVWAFVLLTVSVGVASGSGLTVGHELGHKQNRLDRFGAKIINALCGYGHFSIEHNQGHHTMVATPEDPASARFGESIYRFALREIPETFKRGWELEARRLEKRGHSFWSFRNDILQGYALTAMIGVGLIALLGWIMIPYLVLHHVIGWLQLTQANYVEHYGLKRERKENGRYKPCEPHHSWNTNHIVSNLMLFHLQRHSDHHANPMRPYQSLRNFEELPRLPSGYPGCFAMAWIPPLWFSVMNPKVVAWAGDDMERVNLGT